jgi:hypothetical protein
VGDAAGAVHGLNLETVFEPLQPVPEPRPAAQHDRHHDDVRVVDQAGGQEFADGGRAAADADIPASGGLARLRNWPGGSPCSRSVFGCCTASGPGGKAVWLGAAD